VEWQFISITKYSKRHVCKLDIVDQQPTTTNPFAVKKALIMYTKLINRLHLR